MFFKTCNHITFGSLKHQQNHNILNVINGFITSYNYFGEWYKSQVNVAKQKHSMIMSLIMMRVGQQLKDNIPFLWQAS